MPKTATETALTVHHLARAVARTGFDARALYDLAGVDTTSAASFEVRLPIARIHAAWELVMRALRDPSLPVRAALVPRSEGRSPLALLLSSSATLRDAVPRLASYGAAATDAFAWTIEERRETTTFVFQTRTPRRLGERCHVEYHTADGVHSVRQWTRASWEPMRVAFRHAAPPDVTAHRAHFGRGLVFGAERTEVVLARAVMDLPLVTASHALSELLERQLHAHVGRMRARATDADRLRIALLSELEAGGDTDVAHVARRLGMSVRTLQRRLAVEDTTFQAVLDDTRKEIANELLTAPDARVKEVSRALGFSDTRAFRRAFRRWTGRSPRT
jgi:AraC-like DNA-binding protein